MPDDKPELASVLAELDALAKSYEHGPEVAMPATRAARLLREMAADFDRYARCQDACARRAYLAARGSKRGGLIPLCDCGGYTARERWRLK